MVAWPLASNGFIGLAALLPRLRVAQRAKASPRIPPAAIGGPRPKIAAVRARDLSGNGEAMRRITTSDVPQRAQS